MDQTVSPNFKPERKRYFFREWREFRGLTQARLADRVGLTESSISQLENAKQGFSQETLEALAEALTCEPGDLLMRNPLAADALWSILDNLKKLPRERQLDVERIVKTFSEAA